MFFIGGFNSVIPYLVYLSLIWTLMIIGFGGKIAAVFHGRPSRDIQAEEIISKHGKQVPLQCYQYHSSDQPHIKPASQDCGLSALYFPPLPDHRISTRGLSEPLHAVSRLPFHFRGPPRYI